MAGITQALQNGLSGMRAAGAVTANCAANIGNATNEGYTKKTVALTTQLLGTVSAKLPIRQVDELKLANLRGQASDVSFCNAKQTYFEQVQHHLGNPSDKNSLTESLASLSKSLNTLSTSPSTPNNESRVIEVASDVADKISSFAGFVQLTRSRVDQQLSVSVEEAYRNLQTIADLNKKIVIAQSHNQAIGDYQDQRDIALKSLAQKMNITTSIEDTGAVFVYSESSRTLIDHNGVSKVLSYTPTTVIDANTSYPASINPILFDGFDITREIAGGEIGGLISMRDVELPNIQADLDELTIQLRDNLNTIHNRGVGPKAQRTLMGERVSLNPTTDTFQGTGTLRLAVVNNQTHEFVEAKTIDLTALGTVTMDVFMNTIAAGLNNIDASFDNNRLKLEINNFDPANQANYGIAFVSLSDPEATETTTGLNMGTYFGWNNLFSTGSQITGDGSSKTGIAEKLAVRPDIVADHSLLSRATLNQTTPLPTKAIEAGDGSVAVALSRAFTTNILPNPTPNVPQRSQTLVDFSSAIIAVNSYKMDSLSKNYNTQEQILSQMETEIGSETAVNFTEEMTKMLQTQILFNMSGQIVKNASEMLERLTQI